MGLVFVKLTCRGGGHTTHRASSWVWICYEAYKYDHGAAVTFTPAELSAANTDKRNLAVDLRYFDPFKLPDVGELPPDGYEKVCTHCGAGFLAQRPEALFCTTRCRVASHRKVKREAEELGRRVYKRIAEAREEREAAAVEPVLGGRKTSFRAESVPEAVPETEKGLASLG